MANSDDISIIIGVQDQSVEKAGKKLESMKRTVVSLSKMVQRGTISNAQYENGLRELARSNDKVLGSRQKSTAVIRRMKKEVEQLTKADNVAASSVRRAGKEVDILSAKMDRASNSAAKMGGRMALAGKKTNRIGANMQQVGYQVGDFAVQIQGGTNAMVALGQQGAQLLGIFGAGGALAGAALAIGTAFLAPLFRSKKEAKGLVDEIKELKKELNGLKGLSTSEGRTANYGLIEDAQEKILTLQLEESNIKAEILAKEQSRYSLLTDTVNEQMRLLRVQEELKTIEGGRDEIYASIKQYNDLLHEKQKEMAASESQRLSQEISMLTAKLSNQVTSENLRELEMQHAMLAYEADLKRLGFGQTIIDQLTAQQGTAFRLANELVRASEAALQMKNNLATAATYGSLADGEFMSQPSGVDAFGGLGDYRYDEKSSFIPKKKGSKGGGGGGGSSTSSDPVEKLRQQIELNSQLVGLSKEEATVLTQVHAIQNSLGEDRGKYSRETIVGLIQQNEAYKEQQRVLEETKAKQDELATSIAGSFGDAFMSIIDGTKSAKDAFKDMAKSIIKQLLDVLVIQRLVGSVGTATSAGTGLAGLFSGTLASANGNVFSGGSQVQAYANGGVVNGPTNFPMSGNKMGLMGEAGPEAIMPLKRGANGKLGVQAEGGGGGDVIHISQSFNFQANGDETVKKLIAQAAPKIAQMTKSSMIDDRRRGGVTKSAFG